jgi:hypothetical protein
VQPSALLLILPQFAKVEHAKMEFVYLMYSLPVSLLLSRLVLEILSRINFKTKLLMLILLPESVTLLVAALGSCSMMQDLEDALADVRLSGIKLLNLATDLTVSLQLTITAA